LRTHKVARDSTQTGDAVLHGVMLNANIDVNVRYALAPVKRATPVFRDLDLTIQIPGLLKVAEPFVVYLFRKGNLRILAELKRYVEAQPK
jgi:hypothetical protein